MKWDCHNCGELQEKQVTEKCVGDQPRFLCNHCGKVAPRVIDLTQPMVVMQSVKVTDEMIEKGEIPF